MSRLASLIAYALTGVLLIIAASVAVAWIGH